jgi:hypothetical protein
MINKWVFFIVISFTLSNNSFGQKVIVGHDTLGGVLTDFKDTTLTAYKQVIGEDHEYFFDLDLDGEIDIEFIFDSYGGGCESSYKRTINCRNAFRIIVDTAHYTPAEYWDDEELEVVDSLERFIIPSRFYRGDTIPDERVTQKSNVKIQYRSSGYLGCFGPFAVFHDLDSLFTDTTVIVFEKKAADENYYYLLELIELDFYNLKLISLRSTDTLFTKTDDSHKPNRDITTSFKIYPNPTDEILKLRYDTQQFKNVHLNLTDHLGNIIYKYQTSDFINTADLKPGIYYLEIWSDRKRVDTKKFVKM